jgi:hypothetical protein
LLKFIHVMPKLTLKQVQDLRDKKDIDRKKMITKNENTNIYHRKGKN